MSYYLYSFGKKEEIITTDGSQKIMLRFKYVGLFGFPVAFFRERFLVDEKNIIIKPLSYTEAKELNGGNPIKTSFFMHTAFLFF
jgi:hypothetical protein